MSLQTRLAALISAIKGDFDGLDTRITALEGAGGGGGGTYGFLKRSSFSSANAAPRLTIPWDNPVDSLGSNITWDAGNPTRLTCAANGAYKIGAAVTFQTTQQRGQAVAEIRIDGAPQGLFRGGSYVRNSGSAWDYWCIEVAAEPFNMNAGQYFEMDLARTSGANAGYNTGGSGTIIFRGVSSRIWVERVA